MRSFKLGFVLITIALTLLLSGCYIHVGGPMPESSDAATSDDVENLPQELYISRYYDSDDIGWFVSSMSYSFTLKEKTEYSITSEINLGDLSLSMKNKDTKALVADLPSLKSTAYDTTLEPGDYILTLSGKLSNGYLHVLDKAHRTADEASADATQEAQPSG